MDGSQFDVWTRRRFGLAAGGLTASLVALTGLDDAAAKKKCKKKKKKCKKLGQECNPNGNPKCCDCLACGPIVDGLVENACCRPGSTPCTIANEAECCSGMCVNDFCFCKSNGQDCLSDAQCCSFNCVSNLCAPAG